MTFKQAAYIVAAEEVGKARDWEYAVWANPKLPRKALKKAKIETHAAKMRAARLLSYTGRGVLPEPLKFAIEQKMRSAVIPSKTCDSASGSSDF